MTARILCTAALALALVASSTLGGVPQATAAAITAPRSPTQQQGDVVIPGGTRFISSSARLRLAQAESNSGNQDFLAELARFLSAPMVLDYADRVRDMVEELRSLQEFMVQLDERYPAVVPSLAEQDTVAYAKATELLEFLGFRVLDDTDRIQLQRRVGYRHARPRQMLYPAELRACALESVGWRESQAFEAAPVPKVSSVCPSRSQLSNLSTSERSSFARTRA